MPDPSKALAWLNGRLIPQEEAALPVHDLGVVAGATVTEMIRTFRGIPFQRDEHLDRLDLSLELTGFATRPDRKQICEVMEQLVAHNRALIPPQHDLGIVVFVTAGQNLTYLGAAARSQAGQGSVCVHTFPLPFELWADRYREGQHLASVSVPPLPAEAVSPRAKHRNRLHWLRADREARSRFADAVSILATPDGLITETSAGNVLLVSGRTLRSPCSDSILSGISRGLVQRLAESLGLAWSEEPLTLHDLAQADEVLSSSTTWCLLPVTRFNGAAIGTGQPGPVFQELIAAWSDLVGLDIVRQAGTAAAERMSESS